MFVHDLSKIDKNWRVLQIYVDIEYFEKKLMMIQKNKFYTKKYEKYTKNNL